MLKRSIKRVASFIRVSMDFEEIKNRYEDNPSDVSLKEVYLRECLRRNERPSIFEDWVKKSFSLDLDYSDKSWFFVSKELTTIKFLEGVFAPHLLSLTLNQNDLVDLGPLSKMNAHNLLNISANLNNISSLRTISRLDFPRLTRLYLGNNNIESLSEIERWELPNLIYLDISYNRLKSLNGFHNIEAPKLDEVDFSGNRDLPRAELRSYGF